MTFLVKFWGWRYAKFVIEYGLKKKKEEEEDGSV